VAVPGWGNRLFLIQARRAKTEDEKWKQDQIERLPTIARLSREGLLRLHTYEELLWEAWKRPDSFPAQPFGDVFRTSEITNVASAVRRSVFFQSEMSEYMHRDGLITFAKWLLNGFSDRLLDAPELRQALTEFEVNNLRNLHKFESICQRVAETHYGDAFHLWTGETHFISYFLTTDKKFTGTATNQGKLQLACCPISPSDFLAELGVRNRDPLPFEYGKRYTLAGMPYD
jgi:hypothetical protein